MKSIKEIRYRKQIAAHEDKVAWTHRKFEDAMKWGYLGLEECQAARSLCEKFDDMWHRDAARNKRKVFKAAKEWAIRRRDESENAQREYKAFRERVGLDG